MNRLLTVAVLFEPCFDEINLPTTPPTHPPTPGARTVAPERSPGTQAEPTTTTTSSHTLVPTPPKRQTPQPQPSAGSLTKTLRVHPACTCPSALSQSMSSYSMQSGSPSRTLSQESLSPPSSPASPPSTIFGTMLNLNRGAVDARPTSCLSQGMVGLSLASAKSSLPGAFHNSPATGKMAGATS